MKFKLLIASGVFLLFSACCTNPKQSVAKAENDFSVKQVADEYYRKNLTEYNIDHQHYSQRDIGPFWIAEYDPETVPLEEYKKTGKTYFHGGAMLFVDKKTHKVFRVILDTEIDKVMWLL